MNRSTGLSILGLAVALAGLTGCDRTPRFRPPEAADSTAAVPSDSNAFYIQMARDRWESPETGEEAADLTARVVLQDLRNRPDEPVGTRARALLDSLTVGAETAGGGRWVVANLFARSNPTAGSYPYLFWRDEGGTRYQALEAGGMHLVGAIEDVEGRKNDAARVAALFTRIGAGGQQPFVFVWHRPTSGSSWSLSQSLGADSLGSVGSARFVPPGQDGVVLVSRATIPARGFDECATCPHVYRVRRFRWSDGGLMSAGEEVERSPYYAFVQLIHALVANDPEGARAWMADPELVEAAVGYEWGRSKGLWRLAPGSSPNQRDLVMFRGSQEAYRIHFSSRGDDWVITDFEPTSRNIE